MFFIVLVTSNNQIYEIEQVKHRDGQVMYISYVDRNELPILNETYGYATKMMVLDERDNVLEEYYLDTSRKVICIEGGYSGVKRTFSYHASSQSYSCVEYSYIDENGFPMEITSGYSTVKCILNEDGLGEEEYYFDLSGKQVVAGNGAGGIRQAYNQKQQVETTTYIGIDGNSVKTKQGYMYIRNEYDDNNKTEYIWYFDENQNPVDIGRGQYGTHCIYRTGKKTEYVPVDINGKELFFIDKFVTKHPIIILSVCFICLFLAVLLPRTWRAILLAGFSGFIFYMALLARRSSPEPSMLELFYSYKNFFVDETSRKEVLNNILLFVPFGSVLASLFKNKQVLVCAAAGFTFSLLIEVSQYVFHLGTFQVDDLVGNTLGAMLGALSFLAIKTNKPIPPRHVL